MISWYECDPDTSEALRSKQIGQIRAELATKAIAMSDIPATQAIMLNITVKKLRNRSKMLERDKYIITVHLHV